MPSKWRQKELGTTRCGPPGPQMTLVSGQSCCPLELPAPSSPTTCTARSLPCGPPILSAVIGLQPVPVLPGSLGMLLSNVGRTVRSSSTSEGQGGRSQSGSACSLSPPPLLQSPPSGGSLTAQGVWVCFCFTSTPPPIKQRAPCTRSSALGGTHTQNADPETLPSSLLPPQCAAEAGCRWKPVCGAFPSHP